MFQGASKGIPPSSWKNLSPKVIQKELHVRNNKDSMARKEAPTYIWIVPGS